MITILNRKSVYMGTDLNRFSAVRTALANHHIKYTFRTKDRMGQWTGHGTLRGRTGSLGQPFNSMYEYEVFVHKNDYEEAMWIIQKLS